jgi:hypothetical protein
MSKEETMSVRDRNKGAAYGISLGKALAAVDAAADHLHSAETEYAAVMLLRALRKATREAEMLRFVIEP